MKIGREVEKGGYEESTKGEGLGLGACRQLPTEIPGHAAFTCRDDGHGSAPLERGVVAAISAVTQ
jgi:hypothetical protein